MDAKTVSATLGIYKPEAKLNQVPAGKSSASNPICEGQRSECLSVVGCLYILPFIELIQTILLKPCVSALTRRKLCAEC